MRHVLTSLATIAILAPLLRDVQVLVVDDQEARDLMKASLSHYGAIVRRST